MDHRQPPPHSPAASSSGRTARTTGTTRGGTAPLHALFVLLLVALLVVGAIWLVRRLSPGVSRSCDADRRTRRRSGRRRWPNAADPAVATLRMRYAKGEVSREDYRARRSRI